MATVERPDASNQRRRRVGFVQSAADIVRKSAPSSPAPELRFHDDGCDTDDVGVPLAVNVDQRLASEARQLFGRIQPSADDRKLSARYFTRSRCSIHTHRVYPSTPQKLIRFFNSIYKNKHHKSIICPTL